MTIKHTKSSGNVFADLGLEDAGELLAKAELALQIEQLIKAHGLTQAKAATVLGISQPDVSNLIHRRLESFSTDRLMKLLVRLGQDVIITVRPKSRRRAAGHLMVKAA